MPQLYDWERFWYPLDARLPVSLGYLEATVSDQGATLSELAAVPCLVLLGAPGMGKSYEARRTETELRVRGDAVDLIEAQRRLNLGQTLLDLLDGEHALAWIQGDHTWTVLIDGLDELANGAASFNEGLRRFLTALGGAGGDFRRFRLRLFCRTVEWAAVLDQALAAFWSSKDVQTRQLAPLSKADVVKAADDYLGSVEAATSFVADVEAARADALAAKPVSWNMLVRLFHRHKSLPVRQADLFQQGVRTLLEDQGRADRPGRRAVDLDVSLMMAGRVATAMALSGAGAVVLSDEEGDEVAGRRVFLGEIASGSEPVPPYSVRVAPQDLLDVVRSPLFYAIGPRVYVWAHQTFAEFLAGRYLVAHELEPDRLLAFLTVADPGGGQGGIAPQLREVAAWAAALSTPVFEALLAREPDVLLQSDVAAAEPKARARLVGALLESLRDGELADTFWQLRPLLARLGHPGLAGQLRTAIEDGKLGVQARLGAIDIAEENKVADVAIALVNLALDRTAPIVLRRDAAGAVARLGEASQKRRLGRLLSEQDVDLDDELRGSVLLATWPDHLTVPQLLAALKPPRDPSFIGSYERFIYGLKPGPVSRQDALIILEWIEPFLKHEALNDSSFRRAVSRLFWAAVAMGHDPTVRLSLARLLNVAFNELTQSILEDDRSTAWPLSREDRVAIVVTTLDVAEDATRIGRYLRHFSSSLVMAEDLWIYASAFADAQPTKVRPALAELIVSLSRDVPLDELEELYRLARKHPVLLEAWIAAYSVALDSPSIEWMRGSARRQRDAEVRESEQAVARDEADRTTIRLLDEIEGGDAAAWWRLNLQLFVADNGSYEGLLEFQSDLADTPGWKRLDEAIHRRILAAARTYLVQERLGSLSWLNARTHNRPAAAGYRALRILHDLRPDTYAELGADVWRAWAAAALAFFDNDASAAKVIQTSIVARAYERAPRAVIRALTAIARYPDSEGLTSRTLDVLRRAYDGRLGRALDTLRLGRLSGDQARGLIVSFLVRQSYKPLVDELKNTLAERASAAGARDGPFPEGLAGAAADLMGASQVDVWAYVVDLTEAEPDFARAIWRELASGHVFRTGANLEALGEDLTARAYVALFRLFPERPDDAPRARVLRAVDFVDRFRGSLLNSLVNRGTAAAVEAVERISGQADDAGQARHRLAEARRTYRAKAVGIDARDALTRIALLGPTYPERSLVEEIGPRPMSEPLTAPPVDPVAPISPTPRPSPSGTLLPEARVLRILSVATEWSSAHGGVSTLNRELCIALAALGHEVTCAVIEASEAEVSQARMAGVRIVRSPEVVGLQGADRLLLLSGNDVSGPAPDVVFGHDQVTGAAAHHLSSIVGGAYVHFLHTVPEEIEPLKGRTQVQPKAIYRGYDKQKAQRSLCTAARLVVGIGPRIAESAPVAPGAVAHEFIPGLNVDLLNRPTSRPRRSFCLIGGRMEDADLKGLPIASAAVWQLSVREDFVPRPRLIVRGLDPGGNLDEMRKTGLSHDEWSHCVSPRAFTTVVEELYSDIDEASVVLMPSLAEGFGLTGYEAVAAGRPILITMESGLAEWLIGLERARRIRPGFADACIARFGATHDERVQNWATKISRLIAYQDEAFARAAELRDALKTEFTWQRAAEALIEKLLTIV